MTIQLHWLPIEKPSNGTEVRIREVAEHFTRYGDIYTVYPRPKVTQLSEGLYTHPSENPLLWSKVGRIYLWNLALILSERNLLDMVQSRLTVRSVRNLSIEPDIVIAEGPQMTMAALQIVEETDASLILDKHNAMHILLDQLLSENPLPARLRARGVKNLRKLEERAIENADAVIFQSDEDRSQYDPPSDVILRTIPNGTNVRPADESEIQAAASALGLDRTRPISIFVGSYDYGPNAEAAEFIQRELAPSYPSIQFLLIGRNPPQSQYDNVVAPGYVDDYDATLAAADIALSPLERGAGTKLKMMDYLAAGLPTITTPVGAQGIEFKDGVVGLICDTPDEFTAAVGELISDEQKRDVMAHRARNLGKEFRWRQIFTGFNDVVESLQ